MASSTRSFLSVLGIAGALTLMDNDAWAQVPAVPAVASGTFHPGLGNAAVLGIGGSAGAFHNPFIPRPHLHVDPCTPPKNLLPTPPDAVRIRAPWLVRELSDVPEVAFQKLPEVPAMLEAPKTAEEKEKRAREFQGHLESVVALTLAKINHVNQVEQDLFMKVLIENRPDMAGLPFQMGDACRMSKGVSRQFIIETGREPFNFGGFGGFGIRPPPAKPAAEEPKPTEEEVSKARIAAWMQILGPRPGGGGIELVQNLAHVKHADATHALARIAVFSFEPLVRKHAIDALRTRKHEDYAPIVQAALRYPWPAVADNAAEVMAQLKHDGWIDNLIDALDEPDPRAPIERDRNGTPKFTVREVVRLNHHKNCITCHAPAISDPDFAKTGFSSDFVTGPVTIPGFDPTPSFGGYGFQQRSPDLFVRVDVTYLRQDFSLMQPVPSSKAAPALQRFDFLVRTREVTAKESDAYRAWAKSQGPAYRPPHQKAAQRTLQALTGRKVEATARAWRDVLDPWGP